MKFKPGDLIATKHKRNRVKLAIVLDNGKRKEYCLFELSCDGPDPYADTSMGWSASYIENNYDRIKSLK